MAIHCPKCGATHDVAEFHTGKKIKCHCGLRLDLSLIDTFDDFVRYFESEEEIEKAKSIQADAQLICQLILDEKTPNVDIEIAKKKLKEKVEKLFPGQIRTYEMIYEARFQRLWEQFRPPDSGPGGQA